jgi:hypothetical protein
MEHHRPDSHDAAPDESPVSLSTPGAEDAPPSPPARIGWLEGHLPDLVDPLDPQHPDTAFTETRALRHDGWTPEKQMRFLQRLGECGVVAEACRAVGMSARAAYNLRDRDSLFAAGWEAASAMARPRLADEAFSRAMNGVVERIYKDGAVVAERHRYDNRLTMSVLARLDARADRAEERGAPHLALVARWDEYLAALAEDRRDDGLALLAPPQPDGPPQIAGDRELRELHAGEGTAAGADMGEGPDPHDVWEDSHGTWWTDYPPPPDFAGEQEGEYGDLDYRRALSREEQAVVDADEVEDRAVAEAQRAAWFGLDTPDAPPAPPASPDEPGTGLASP